MEDGHDLNALFDDHLSDTPEKQERRRYFSELFRLQGELVKLQSWVVKTGHKVVILFEGRDAAGKGGVIKRITQRLNPRVPGGRPARPQRPRTHPVVLSALRLAPAGRG
jgi:polyphosphate kinase 2 (PPK2 family)